MSPADKLLVFGRQSKLILLLFLNVSVLLKNKQTNKQTNLQSLIDASIDLMSGYWQAKMPEKDHEKTAFACHRTLI